MSRGSKQSKEKRLIWGNASGENKKQSRLRYVGCNLTSKVRPKQTSQNGSYFFPDQRN